MKQFILSSAVVMAILITSVAMADSTSAKKTTPPVKNAVSLNINTPAPGGTWYFSSKQYTEGSISGLSSGKYKIVAFLKSLADCQKGIVAVDILSGSGKYHLQFVVNEIEYIDGTYALTDGKYELSVAIYEENRSSDNSLNLGKKIIEKSGGFIDITGSDVQPGKQRKYD